MAELRSASDFNGVSVQPMIKLNDGYELIVGSSLDPQFGPVLLFGTGGSLVEVFRDRALGLPPLTTTLARRMMEQTKIYEALKGVRGRGSVDLDMLEKVMVRFGELAVEQPWISEMDINPLFVSEHTILALDARVVLHPAETDLVTVPQPAIRPYPTQYVNAWKSEDGSTELTIRPIRPDDEPLAVDFHRGLSEGTVRLRYMYNLPLDERIDHDRLAKLSFIDYDREIALVGIDNTGDEPKMVAVARIEKMPGTDEVAEYGILVADDYQGKGLGTELMRQLIDVGKQEGVKTIFGRLLSRNTAMVAVTERLGFKTRPVDANTIMTELAL